MSKISSTLLLALACTLLGACSGYSKDDKVHKVLKISQAAYERGDYATAVQGFQLLANQGNPRAEFFLGEMYLTGSGVKKDIAHAVRLEQMAAKAGSPAAQFTLAQMYETGNKALKQDKTQALFWYGLSASTGDEQAIRKRAALEDSLDPAQIKKAHQLEKKWVSSHKH